MKKRSFSLLGILLAWCAMAAGASAVTYDTHNMAPSGSNNVTLWGNINNRGDTVACEPVSTGGYRTFFYNPVTGTRNTIGNFSSPWSVTGISDNAQITGILESRALTWSESQGVTQLGSLNGEMTSPSAINGSGAIVGTSGSLAFYWICTDGMCQADNLVAPRAINDAGIVVGCIDVQGDCHAAIWSLEDGMQDLGTLGGRISYATDVNSKGEVLGYSYVNDYTQAVFVWDKDQGMRELFTLPFGSFYPRALNDDGWIVGSCSEGGFVWSPYGGLNYVAGLDAYDINNAGQITGIVRDGTTSRLVLWNPVPEPSSLLALFAGIGAMGAVIRRRRG